MPRLGYRLLSSVYRVESDSMVALRRVFLSGLTGSGFCLTKYRAFMATPSSWRDRGFDKGYMPNVRLLHPYVFIVDTTTLMRSIEAKGVPSEQAKAIISALRKTAGSADMEPITDHIEKISDPKLREVKYHRQRVKRELYGISDSELDEIREEAEEGIAEVSPTIAEERQVAMNKSYAATIAAHVILVATIFIISKKDGPAETSA